MNPQHRQFLRGLAMGLLLCLAAVGVWTMAQGALTPTGTPAPTMRTLEQIYSAVGGEISQRSGFAKSYTVNTNSTQTVLTVPAGKRFVLLQIYDHMADTQPTNWNLAVNSVTFIHGHINRGDSSNTFNYRIEFPDRCVTVDAGSVLTINNNNSTFQLNITLVGYYYNI